VTITGGTALDSDAIDQMIKDAESHAAEDAERKEAAEAHNAADHAVYTVGKQLADHGDVLSEDDTASIQAKLDELKKLLEDDNASTDVLTEGTAGLMESAQVIGERMSEASQAEAAAAAASGDETEAADDDVVEAEVVEAEVVDEDEE
jgi:molecular chaperone DnaK